MTLQSLLSLITGNGLTIGVLALNLLCIGWFFLGVRKNQRDLSDIKSSLKHTVRAVQPANIPDVIVPQVNTPSVQNEPPQAETIIRSQAKSSSSIVAFIAARQAGSSLQEAAQQYDLTEDEAVAVSVSYRDAAPAPANNDAIS